MDNNKIKHLEFVQNTISRLAGNSFLLKGWAVTLVAGIFTLSSKDSNPLFFIVAYIPIIVFWCLDAYYLLQERLFRVLYDHIRSAEKEIDVFCMDISKEEYHKPPNTYLDCWISKSLIIFYLPLAILSAIITVVCVFS